MPSSIAVVSRLPRSRSLRNAGYQSSYISVVAGAEAVAAAGAIWMRSFAIELRLLSDAYPLQPGCDNRSRCSSREHAANGDQALHAAPLLLILIALWLLLYGSFTLRGRHCWTTPTPCTPKWRARWWRATTGSRSTPTAFAIWRRRRCSTGAWRRASSGFGAHTWSARLPLALYTLLLLLLVYALGARCFGDAMAGFYAALVLATSFGLFIFTRILIPDAMVCLWLTLAMLCFWRSLAGSTRANAAGFAAACALGVLTKGLIGVVFPLLIVAVYLAMTRNLAHLRRWHPLLGALIFFAIAAPWHVAAGMANPTEGHPGALPTAGNVHGWYWFYFVNEHLLRYLNRRIPRDYDTVPLALFWGLLLVWMLPWSAFLGQALCRVPLRRWWRRAPLNQTEPARLLFFVWAAVPMLFFSFSTRQEYYVLPAMPALALLARRLAG